MLPVLNSAIMALISVLFCDLYIRFIRRVFGPMKISIPTVLLHLFFLERAVPMNIPTIMEML
jgi:hypothetical protein